MLIFHPTCLRIYASWPLTAKPQQSKNSLSQFKCFLMKTPGRARFARTCTLIKKITIKGKAHIVPGRNFLTNSFRIHRRASSKRASLSPSVPSEVISGAGLLLVLSQSSDALQWRFAALDKFQTYGVVDELKLRAGNECLLGKNGLSNSILFTTDSVRNEITSWLGFDVTNTQFDAPWQFSVEKTRRSKAILRCLHTLGQRGLLMNALRRYEVLAADQDIIFANEGVSLHWHMNYWAASDCKAGIHPTGLLWILRCQSREPNELGFRQRSPQL